jgi:hypothetical protein
MSSETPSLAECIAFMSFCVKDESTIVLREHMAEGRAIVGYLRDLAAARRDAQALRDLLHRFDEYCDATIDNQDDQLIPLAMDVKAALAADATKDTK